MVSYADDVRSGRTPDAEQEHHLRECESCRTQLRGLMLAQAAERVVASDTRRRSWKWKVVVPGAVVTATIAGLLAWWLLSPQAGMSDMQSSVEVATIPPTGAMETDPTQATHSRTEPDSPDFSEKPNHAGENAGNTNETITSQQQASIQAVPIEAGEAPRDSIKIWDVSTANRTYIKDYGILDKKLKNSIFDGQKIPMLNTKADSKMSFKSRTRDSQVHDIREFMLIADHNAVRTRLAAACIQYLIDAASRDEGPFVNANGQHSTGLMDGLSEQLKTGRVNSDFPFDKDQITALQQLLNEFESRLDEEHREYWKSNLVARGLETLPVDGHLAHVKNGDKDETMIAIWIVAHQVGLRWIELTEPENSRDNDS